MKKQKTTAANENRKSPNVLARSDKARIALIIAAILLLILIPVLVIVFTPSSAPVLGSDADCYFIDVEFSEDMKTALIAEDMMFTNDSGTNLDEIKFHLYPNAFKRGGVNEKEILNGEYGKIDILSVQIDGINRDFSLEGSDGQILTIYGSINDDEAATVSISAELTLPSGGMRLGITENTVNLTGFYPVLCAYENGNWRVDEYAAYGDPFMSDVANYYVTAAVPEDYLLAYGGEGMIYDAENGYNHYEITAVGIRDFGMCASKHFKTAETAVMLTDKSVSVKYYYINDDTPKQTASVAADAIKVFSEAFGDYAYSSLTLAESALNAGGMEYGAFVILADNLSPVEMKTTAVHETAHQWWYGAVGSDQLNDAWLDEGLTEFCTGYYHKLKGDDQAFNSYIKRISSSYDGYRELQNKYGLSANMSRHLTEFISEGEYVSLTYLRGAMMFDAVLAIVGEENFNAALSNYYRDNFNSFATIESLSNAFEKADCRIAPVIENWVNGTVV